MEENTQDEYDDAFELGRIAMTVDIYLDCNVPISEIADFKSTYFGLKAFAKKLHIELPRQIPEEITAEHEKRRFYQNQINYVEACITKQSQYSIDMFEYGKNVELYIGHLMLAKKSANIEDTDREVVIRNLKNCKRNLQLIANKKRVDISEELSKGQASLELGKLENDEELKQIRLQLRRKLGKRKQLEKKRSEIDPSRFITNDHWTISLVRLPDTSNNEHAFLVLEGQSGNTSRIWFADLVANDALDLLGFGTKDGKVRIDYHESNEEPGPSEKLLFRCSKKLMKIRKGDRLLHSTWQIPKSTGEVLVRNLKTLQDNPPKYNILGNTMLAVSSATSSSNSTGHNCFTFAKVVLHSLPDDYIVIMEDTLDKWIYSATSRYLVDKQPINPRLNMLGFRSIFMFVAGVVAAVFLFKHFNFNV